jgi:hypothetical protein
VIRADGYKEWWQNGKRHRTNGPAVEYANGGKEWWQNGMRHRVDGPAIECAGGGKRWFLNDEMCSEHGFVQAVEQLGCKQ